LIEFLDLSDKSGFFGQLITLAATWFYKIARFQGAHVAEVAKKQSA